MPFELLALICLLMAALGRGDRPCADGPPVEMSLRDCCDTPAPNIADSLQTECKEKFLEQRVRQLQEDDGQLKGCCIAECIMNGTNIYAEGMLDRDGITDLYRDALFEWSRWADIVRATIDDCFRMVEEMRDQMELYASATPSYDGEQICHPISGAVTQCIDRELFQRCPRDLYRRSDECDSLAEYSKQCPIF